MERNATSEIADILYAPALVSDEFINFDVVVRHKVDRILLFTDAAWARGARVGSHRNRRVWALLPYAQARL